MISSITRKKEAAAKIPFPEKDSVELRNDGLEKTWERLRLFHLIEFQIYVYFGRLFTFNSSFNIVEFRHDFSDLGLANFVLLDNHCFYFAFNSLFRCNLGAANGEGVFVKHVCGASRSLVYVVKVNVAFHSDFVR